MVSVLHSSGSELDERPAQQLAKLTARPSKRLRGLAEVAAMRPRRCWGNRHIAVDTYGFLLMLSFTYAGIQDAKGAEQTSEAALPMLAQTQAFVQ